ncbi:MAG: lysophospholipid acyltransferase family protein [Elusimicrobiota bacterium]
MKDTRPNYLYRFGRFLFAVFFRLFWRTQVVGHKNIPPEGGVIIAANHISFLDPPLLGTAIKRETNFLAKEELFDLPVLGFLMRRVNAHPLKRDKQDVRALKTAMRILAAGKLLVLFPEGTRSKTGELQQAKSGIGMLSAKLQVPIIPAFIWKTSRFWRFHRMAVIFGQPIYPPAQIKSKEDYKTISEEVMKQIAQLKIVLSKAV